MISDSEFIPRAHGLDDMHAAYVRRAHIAKCPEVAPSHCGSRVSYFYDVDTLGGPATL